MKLGELLPIINPNQLISVRHFDSFATLFNGPRRGYTLDWGTFDQDIFSVYIGNYGYLVIELEKSFYEEYAENAEDKNL